jgi:hypothetical protein
VRWRAPCQAGGYGRRSIVASVVREHIHTRTQTCEVLALVEHPPPSPDYVGGEAIIYRHAWDGTSWSGGYDPFCTLHCALDYARKAYKREQGRS